MAKLYRKGFSEVKHLSEIVFFTIALCKISLLLPHS